MPTEQCVFSDIVYLWYIVHVYNCICRAAECPEQRETRLARRRVADRARFAAISR